MNKPTPAAIEILAFTVAMMLFAAALSKLGWAR